jgi:hypothetical protein
MQSKTRPSCSPSPNFRRRRATLVVQVWRCVAFRARKRSQPAVHARARSGWWPGLARGSSGCPASWTSSTVSCPRRDLLGATAIPALVFDITRAPLALPSRAPGPRVTDRRAVPATRAGVSTCCPEAAPEQVGKHHGLADLGAAWSRSGASRFGPWPAPIGAAATPSPARSPQARDDSAG